MKRRHQASGIRHQGFGNETGVALAEVGSNGKDSSLEPVVFVAPAVVANGLENLKPETCNLKPKPLVKADG